MIGGTVHTMTFGAEDREGIAAVIPRLRVMRAEVLEARRAASSRRRKLVLAVLGVTLGLALGVSIVLVGSIEARDPQQAWFGRSDWLRGEIAVNDELRSRPPRYLSEEEFLAELEGVETPGT